MMSKKSTINPKKLKQKINHLFSTFSPHQERTNPYRKIEKNMVLLLIGRSENKKKDYRNLLIVV